jgi:hypothetical protein
MALKFRRGTTAQQSGSLAFGEPFVNTTLGTLIVGGDTGDIILASSTGLGLVSGSSQVTLQSTTGFTAYNTALATITGSLITSASADRVSITNLNTLTSSALTRFTNLESTTASLNTSVSNLNTFSSSQLTKDSTLATYTASVDGRFTTIGSVTASYDGRFTSLATITGSLITSASADRVSITNINTFSASALTRLSALEIETSNLETFSGSQLTKDSTLATYTGSNDTKWSTLGSLSGSFARTNSANIFNGNQTITGSLFVSQDLVVAGSSSIQNISSSTLNIGTNLITVAVNQPSVRFGGIAVIDSGSSGASGSLLYDSVQDEFIFVHKGNGTNVTSSHFVLGPETVDNLGNETYLTSNRIPKGTGKEHLNDSNITDSGTLITLGSNAVVNGTFYATGATLVSGSSQISHDSTTGYSANRHVDHTSVTLTAGGGLTGGGDISTNRTFAVGAGSYITVNADDVAVNTSTLIPAISGTILSSITGDVTISAGGVATISANSIALGTDTTGDYVASLVAGTNITLSNNSGEGATPTIGLTNNAITIAGTSTSLGGSITAATILNGTGVVSGSSQVNADSITNFDSNVLAYNNSLGVVSGSAQINVASTTGDIALGTRTSGNYVASLVAGTNITLTNNTGEGATPTIALTNNTISGISLGSNLATLTIGTGLSGTSYNGSTAVTIANTGVTSNVAGSGISVSGATGAVTITNSGVRSIAAGTGVSVSATTGDNCSISIGQSVATNATPTFGNLTINGTITATGDITAYYTSDRRHKNNIQTISNAVLKVKQLNGVTWEWNDDVNEVTKSTPKTGLIAQEVQQVLPQVVTERQDGFLALDYSKMVGLLVEAIKEQQIQIDQLKAQIGSK